MGPLSHAQNTSKESFVRHGDETKNMSIHKYRLVAKFIYGFSVFVRHIPIITDSRIIIDTMGHFIVIG